MKKVHQDGVTTEMGEIALALFYQLQEPGTDPNGVSVEERNRAMANSMRSIFGLGPIEEPVGMLGPDGNQMVIYPEGYKETAGVADSEEGEDPEKDDRYPKITAEDWRARERARRLLKNILSRQAEACETQRQALLKETVAGPSAWERAAEITPDGSDALVVRRLQDANFREVRRVTNLLLKLKRHQRQKETFSSKYVDDNKDS
jgi:ParB-like chromosome segregation protein Spo0J